MEQLRAQVLGLDDVVDDEVGGEPLEVDVLLVLAAPVGDLFESLVKRDLDVKDTGGFFGPHGGVLDRLDAVFFSVPVAYYVTLAVT